MEYTQSKQKPKSKFRDNKNVYTVCQITNQITIPFTGVGKNLHQTLESFISKMISGKCIREGYVKPDSIRVITYTIGKLQGDQVVFDVVFSCSVCFPVAGMNFNCVAKNITKAGIRAESADETPSPFVLFVSRDHFYTNPAFAAIAEGDKFMGRVIAQRFELNDKYISIIAELPAKEQKIKLVMKD